MRKTFLISLFLLSAPALLSAENGNLVSVGKTELFTLHAAGNSSSAIERAQAATRTIEKIMSNPDADPDSVKLVIEDSVFSITFRKSKIITILPADTSGTGKDQKALAESRLASIRAGITAERERSFAFGNLAKLALGILFPFLIIVVYILIHRLYSAISKRVVKREGSAFRGIKIRGVEFIPARLQVSIILKLLLFLKWALIVVVFYAMILAFFTLFPPTKVYTEAILDASLNWLRSVAYILVDFAKFLIAVAVLYLVARVLWGLTDVIMHHYENSPGSVRLSLNMLLVLNRLFRALIIFLFATGLVAVIPGKGEYIALALLSVAFIFVGIASLPFIASVLTGLALLLFGYVKPGDPIAVGDKRGRIISIGVFWTRISVGRSEETILLNSYFLKQPIGIRLHSQRKPGEFDPRD